ncbi:methyltransferase domain-containing protein [Ferrimonas gelatinilytica]|uniref:Malonyl-ACP O-methyltransferase BioC n=1 Tax=Ferrimonas gelatinilytica TaxID=1255257 RepID=A0ABP9SHW1_9GAMM
MTRPLNSEAVAACFGRAAQSYDGQAQLQQWVADRLLAGITPAEMWLDIGAGTGYATARLPAGTVLALDLALPMLKQGRALGRIRHPLCADLHRLPLRPGRLDGICANMALQWSQDLPATLRQLYDLLRPGGQLRFSVPVAGCFPQLAPLIHQGQLGCHQFSPSAQLAEDLAAAGFAQIRVETLRHTLYYDTPKALLGHFKATGANRHASGGHQGLRGRLWWEQVVASLEQHRTDAGIPLTWQTGLFTALRSGE